MNTSKNIQVPMSLLLASKRLVEALKSLELPPDVQNLMNDLETQIQAKFERIERRELYAAYKTAQPETDEREAARQDYLNRAGIHKDWRSQKETNI